MIFPIVIILILLAFVAFCIKMGVSTSNAQKKTLETRMNKMNEMGVTDVKNLFRNIEHINGLDVPEGSSCVVGIGSKGLVIECSNKQYIISQDKIIAVDYKMDIDTKIFNKNGSLIKGIAGGALFGVAGAIAGTQGKQTIQKEVQGYAIIGYLSSTGDEKYIVLRDSIANTHYCAKIVEKLKPLRTNIQRNQVEL